MKFNFKIQQYQIDSVDSVINVFRGQPFSNPVNYRRDIGKKKSAVTYSQVSFVGGEQEQFYFTDDFDDAAGDAESLAGLLLEIKGEFPSLNEEIVCNGLTFKVMQRGKNRISKIMVTAPEAVSVENK